MTEMAIHVPYVELHCHSYFSLLDGASSPETLVARAVALGYNALALTDHDGLYGVIRFWQASQTYGVKPIIGAEVTLEDGEHLVLLAETRAGYANLSRLISKAQLEGSKGEPQLDLQTLNEHAASLLCLAGCAAGRISKLLAHKKVREAKEATASLKDIFSDRLWIELQRHHLPHDIPACVALLDLARVLGLEVVATNNVHYAQREDRALHDLLTCVRHRATLPEALVSGILHPNSERHLRSPNEMSALFADHPSALHNSLCIAERCNVALDFAAQRLPNLALPENTSPYSYLHALCEEGLQRKIDPADRRARSQLEHELGVIERVGLTGYFLVVWDIVRFARNQGIRCQGRGSAANSLVAYLLDITPINPLEHDLLFERFLNEGTSTIPDIDIDFAADRREEVIQYVYQKYGKEHVGMVCNVVTYRARSALRDAAKALAFPPDVIDRAAKALDTRSTDLAADQVDQHFLESQALLNRDLPWHVLTDLMRQMEGVPRHLSIHVGGMLITFSPLVDIVPLERATMPDRVVVQWNKDSVEDAGLIKVDLLALHTLGMVEEALAHIQTIRKEHPDLDGLPLDDPRIYAVLQEADTIGCFQVESRAQMQMLPQLLPTCFEDLIVEISLVRPGPIQGNMVHPYLRRRQGAEPVTYVHPTLEPILQETLGVMVFQEQVIRVAVAVAGFSPAEADQLRRAMSRSRSEEAMLTLRAKFIEKAQANRVSLEIAETIFEQLLAFSGYGFCKSHAAAFAHIAYQTLYLKAYYPAMFYCALLNHQPMGFYRPDVLIGDARRHSVPVLLPDINCSGKACSLEQVDASSQIQLGLDYVHSLSDIHQARITERRSEGPFRDLHDFCRRTRLPRKVIENLIRSGAMDSFGKRRRELLWELGGLMYDTELNLQAPVQPVDLPELSDLEQTLWEYELLGLAPEDHLMGFYRERLRAKGILSSQELETRQDGETVWVAGLVVVRQRPPSAKGYVFVTLEDEEGLMNLIIKPSVYERYHAVVHRASVLLAQGELQVTKRQVNLVVSWVAVLGY